MYYISALTQASVLVLSKNNIKRSSMNTVLFVNANVDFSENLFVVQKYYDIHWPLAFLLFSN